MPYRPRIVNVEENASKAKVRIGPTDLSSAASSSSATSKPTKQHQQIRRRIVFDTGVVSHAAGSATVEFGETKVLCSVNGPRSIRRVSDLGDEGVLSCSVRLAPFSQYDSKGLSGRDVDYLRIKAERVLSNAVLRAIESSVRLEKMPKSLLEIYVLILSDDGGAEAAAITCASLALANSGVELFDLVPCVNVGLSQNGTFVCDPSKETLEKQCSGSICVSLMPASETVTLTVDGPISFQKTGEAVKSCFAECIHVHKLMRDHLIKKAIQEGNKTNIVR